MRYHKGDKWCGQHIILECELLMAFSALTGVYLGGGALINDTNWSRTNMTL